jgi:methyl-accepting chemotaxis protein
MRSTDRTATYSYETEESMAFASKVAFADTAVVITTDVSERADDFAHAVDEGETVVLNKSATVQFDENESDLLTRYDGGTAAPAVQSGFTGESGVYETSDTVVAYAPVPDRDLVVVKRAPTSEAYVLAAVVSRGMIAELRALSTDARAIANGDLSTEVERADRVDEVGEVRDGFHAVSEYLGTVAGQADAIAAREFEDPVLEEEVPGELGTTLEKMRTDIEGFIEDLEAARDEARQSRVEAEELASALETQADRFGQTMDRVADGDLTARLATDVDAESMRDIATATNEMLDGLESTLLEIQSFAATVDETTDEVVASAEEVRDASEEVAETVQGIAADADRQNETLAEVADEMTDLSAAVEEVAASADEVAATSKSAVEAGERGRERADEAIAVMGEVERQADRTVDEFASLDEEMDRIGEVVDLIDDIAEQTNMLALNASIEAARAGEAGEGFAVVADEIKSLASETSEATDEVAELVTGVQRKTGDAVGDMREMSDQVDRGRETVAEAVDAFEAVVDEIEDVNAGIQSIDDATDDQAASTEAAVSMVDRVDEISDETAAGAQQSAAATEEQTASIDEVTDSIGSLSDDATNLADRLEQFEVGRADVGAVSAEVDADGVPATDDD